MNCDRQVLAHRAVACFVSHCGWNSTMEGTRNGVSFLCWPYFCDQYLDRSYISDVWRTGLAVWGDANEVVTKEELSGKVEQAIGDGEIKDRVRLLKDAARRSITEGGPSYENFNKFVNLLSE
jgi:UDP:flavonoid glycosyltransferase YjiC (YdhE family)